LGPFSSRDISELENEMSVWLTTMGWNGCFSGGVCVCVRESLFLYIEYVHVTLLLLIHQFGPRTTCYMFCIVIHISHWSSFRFMVIYRLVNCIGCYMFEMLRLGRCI